MEKLLLYFLLSFVVVSIVLLLWENRRRLDWVWMIYRSGWRAYARGFVLALGTLTVGVVAYDSAPDWLRWSWFRIIPDAPSGSLVTAPLTASQAHPTIWVGTLAVLAFYTVLLLVMPFIARREEEIFRAGHVDSRRIAWQSLKFGLMHMVVGVPVVIALTLALPGWVLGLRYRRAHKASQLAGHPLAQAMRDGIAVSTVDHTLYNFWLLTLVAAGALFALLGGPLKAA
jgi:hypothetical protein